MSVEPPPTGVLSQVLAATPDGILMVDRHGRIGYANPALEAQFGYGDGELVDQPVGRVIPGLRADRLPRSSARGQAPPRAHELRLDGVHRDGSGVPVQISLAPMAPSGAGVAVAIVRDLRRRRELEDERPAAPGERATEESATAVDEMAAVTRLAGGLAHDFNNLLAIVSGYARRLIVRPELACAREDLEQIVAASDRGLELARQLLALTRGRNAATPLDPDEVIRELEPILRRLLGSEIVLELRLQQAPAPVMIDRTALEQILMNLIINAADAMPAGGALTVASAGTGRHVVLSVSDTGAGMSRKVVRRMFEPGFSTKGDRGTGMGLATVRATVEQVGGSIDVRSSASAGTAVSVTLPVAGPAPPPSPPARPTVLLVEDEPALRKLVATILADQDYEVLQGRDGPQALAVAEGHQGPIDLLVTDVVMPGLAGPDLAQRLQALRPRLGVLYLSGYSDSRLISRGGEPANGNLLVKPFTPDQLIARVGRALAIASR